MPASPVEPASLAWYPSIILMNVGSTFGLLGWLWLAAGAFAQTKPGPPLELHVKNVVYLHATHSPVVILVDKDEKRFLPIWIGLNEAQAIALEMYEFTPPRPMTHDLFGSLIKELDAKIEKLVITETKANTYFAMLYVSSQGKTKNIDCRPSDGIAIALRAKAPILASESVMANAMPVPEEVAEGAVEGHRATALSLTVQALTPDLAAAFGLGAAKGVLVSDSQREQIEKGDVILAVAGATVETVEEFKSAVEKAPAKKDVELKLVRKGKTLTVHLPKATQDDRR